MRKHQPYRAPNETYRSREYLVQSEIEAMLQVARWRGNHPIRDYALILMLFRHGLRAQEAAQLRWDAISLKDQTIYIRRLKRSHSGTHPLQPDEVEALTRLQEKYRARYPKWVFSGQHGNTLTNEGINRIVRATAAAAGIEIKAHTHMLRHSVGHWLCMAGNETGLIQNWLGHKDIRHTVQYTHFNPIRFQSMVWDAPTTKKAEQPKRRKAIYIVRK